MNNLDVVQSRIYTKKRLKPVLEMWKFQDKKIVFTNGCFDILHAGHIDYLSKAADLGNILIIGINSDDSVKRLKGSGRPLQNLESRFLVLASLFFVKAVIAFDEDTPYELIKFIQPDVLVKGSDYSENAIIGADVVKSNKGTVATIPFLEGYSTSLIEKKIIRDNQRK
jgi:D-glycero-beta-D-manno-heptose 1-phosphate adenylyltransferase